MSPFKCTLKCTQEIERITALKAQGQYKVNISACYLWQSYQIMIVAVAF